jgi:hypothetical protein
MRCYECGYQNAAGVKVCIKCGTKLTETAPAAQQPATPSQPVASRGADGSIPTMRGAAPSAPSWDSSPAGGSSSPATPSSPAPGNQGATTMGGNVLKCDACSYYPLRVAPSVSSPCPNCGFKGAPGSSAPGVAATPSAVKTVKVGSIASEANIARISLSDVVSGNTHTFEGGRIPVGRQELDAQNPAISSGEHLVFEVENGQVFVRDSSSNGATYVQVRGKVAITDGMQIVIGNKVFNVNIS